MLRVGSSTDERREIQRTLEFDRRKKRRKELLESKRIRYEEEETPQDERRYTLEQMTQLAGVFHRGSAPERLAKMRTLRLMMAQDVSLIDAFLSVNNSIQALVGQLAGRDSSIQVEAAWCISNMSAGTRHHGETALKHAAVYLISFLDGQNAVLKDHCCWALGNMAANGPESQRMLQSAGILTQLCNIVMTNAHDTSLMQSALFALANILKNDEVCSCFRQADTTFIQRLLRFQHGSMTKDCSHEITLDICRILFHLSAREEFHTVLLSTGVFTGLTEVLVEYVRHTPNDYIMAITPLIRCLGNLASRPSDTVTMATQNGQLVGCTNQLLRANATPFYFQKEALWMMNNLTAHAPAACDQCIKSHLHTFLVERLLGQPTDVQNQSLLCLRHLFIHSTNIFNQLVEAGLVVKLSSLMKGPEESALQALLLCQMLLQHSPQIVQPLCDEARMTESLNSLMFVSNQRIQQAATDILETYW